MEATNRTQSSCQRCHKSAPVLVLVRGAEICEACAKKILPAKIFEKLFGRDGPPPYPSVPDGRIR